MIRLRCISTEGKTYYSLTTVCHCLMGIKSSTPPRKGYPVTKEVPMNEHLQAEFLPNSVSEYEAYIHNNKGGFANDCTTGSPFLAFPGEDRAVRGANVAEEGQPSGHRLAHREGSKPPIHPWVVGRAPPDGDGMISLLLSRSKLSLQGDLLIGELKPSSPTPSRSLLVRLRLQSQIGESTCTIP